MNWSIRNDAPVYTQLVDQIARAIILGQFPPGSKLPSVRDFASDAARARRARASGADPDAAHGRPHRDGGSGAHRTGKAAAGAGRHRRILAGAGAARL